jgi:hypothetical protein
VLPSLLQRSEIVCDPDTPMRKLTAGDCAPTPPHPTPTPTHPTPIQAETEQRLRSEDLWSTVSITGEQYCGACIAVQAAHLATTTLAAWQWGRGANPWLPCRFRRQGL